MFNQIKPAANLPHKLATMLAALLLFGLSPAALTAVEGAARADKAAASPMLAPCSSISEVETTTITLGKSKLVTLPAPVARIIVGGLSSGYAGKPIEVEPSPKAAQQAMQPGFEGNSGGVKSGVADVDVMLLSPDELYLLGKRVGAMNVILQSHAGRCTVMDITVVMDSGTLQSKLIQLMPDEKNIKVAAAEDTLILNGEVRDAVKVERAMIIATAYAPEKKIVNLLHASAAQQVMLEVKVAEVSKTLLNQLGASANLGGDALISSFLTSGSGLLRLLRSGRNVINLNGEKDDGIVRILAEPNIMAISGQQASFLSGGKIFIPVAQSNLGFGTNTITLEEKEFGVGVKFTPTVLDGDRINLKVASEVSELSQTGSPFTTVGGVTAVLPSFTTRRSDTTVQLNDGQSFAIAGLIQNNSTATIKRFPVLGELPLIGALFRSSEFQKDMTELLFVITPHLVKPLPPDYALPTDNYKEPSRVDMQIGGKLESDGDAADKPQDQNPEPAPDAMSADKPEMKPEPNDVENNHE